EERETETINLLSPHCRHDETQVEPLWSRRPDRDRGMPRVGLLADGRPDGSDVGAGPSVFARLPGAGLRGDLAVPSAGSPGGGVALPQLARVASAGSGGHSPVDRGVLLFWMVGRHLVALLPDGDDGLPGRV